MKLSENAAITKWFICLSSALFFFYIFIQMTMFNAISAELMQSFNITAEKLSQLSAVMFYANMLCLLPAGFLLDYFKTRKVLLYAVGICVLATFFFALAKNFPLAMITHFIVGMTNAISFLACMLLASHWFPPKQLAFATGLIVTIGMLGGVVGQTPFAVLAQHCGWRNAMLINAALGLLIFLIVYLFVFDKKTTPEQNSYNTNEQPQYPLQMRLKYTLSNLQTWYCGLYTSFLNLPLMVLGGLWGTAFLIQARYFTQTQASTITSMLFLGTIIGSPLFGAFSDYVEKRLLPMFLGVIFSIVCMLIIIFFPSKSFLFSATLFFLTGFFTSSQVIGYPAIAESNPPHITAFSLSLASILIMGSVGVFQQLFGYLLDLTWDKQLNNGIPLYSAENFYFALLLFPVTLIIALVLCFAIKETFNQKKING